VDDGPDVEDTLHDAPICPSCGVTALPAESEAGFVCENPDCEAFGERL
jgi:predicted RNA-binding Zn-ribbon protein involved in translation (DUF1610 family)